MVATEWSKTRVLSRARVKAYFALRAGVAESADAQVSKTCARKGVRVQVPPPAPFKLAPPARL